MSPSLPGAVVAIVGADGGIGSPVTHQLAVRGARLVLAGSHPKRFGGLGIDDAVCVELDVCDPKSGDARAACALESFGRLDGLINAAGIVAFGPLIDTDESVIDELFLTNVIGPLWLVKRLIPFWPTHTASS